MLKVPPVILLSLSVALGLLTPMIARDRPRPVATVALTIHALLAGAGFVLLCAWVAAG